ncbi:MAG: recombinase family protein [Caulobacteraceae bacterium]
MENSKKPKAAIYVRVSTEEQALEGQSAPAQIGTLKQYCGLYGIEVYKVYEDMGLSGKNLKDRPGLSELIADCSRTLFDMVLVWKISRLSRNLKDLLIIIDIFEKNNIHFISYSEKFDTSTPVGRMTLQLLGSIAEFERNTIVENVKLGLGEYARKGGKASSVLGYNNIGKKLVINEKESEAVKLIFDLYINSSMNCTAIALRLNELGFRTKRGLPFRGSGISAIISNPVYIGLNRHNINSGKEYTVQGHHDPIIDNDTWYKAQEKRSKNKAPRRKQASGSSVLSGYVECGHCGTLMNIFYTYSGNKTYRYYRCSNCRAVNKKRGNYINGDKLDSYVINVMKALLSCETVAADLRQFYLKLQASDMGSVNKPAETILKEIKRLKKCKSRYLKMFEAYKISDNITFVDRINDIDYQIKQLEEKRNYSSEPPTGNSSIQSFEHCVEALKELAKNSDLKKLKILLPFFIKRIIITEKRITIETTFPVEGI